MQSNSFNPFDSNTTIPMPSFRVCPSCGAYVQGYHACSTVVPEQPPIRTPDGMVSDMLMYSDFKKLFRFYAVSVLRSKFEDRLVEVEQASPESTSGFGIDVILAIFDDVAKE